MKQFRVRNFEKFQHYKDRNPPWIKLYRSILDDPRFFQLSEPDRFLLLGIFILASQTDNRLPADQAWLKTKLLTKRAVPIDLLVTSEWLEWIEDSAIKDASKHASKLASKHAINSASAAASTYASPRALAREETEKSQRQKERQIPLPQSSQTQIVNRSIEAAGERSQITPETLENVWFAIQKHLQLRMTPGGFLQHWSGLKLLGFDPKYIHVTCPYDPGDDTEWMEDQLTKAAVEAGHDRGRRVKIGVLLPDSPMDVERPA